MSNLHYLALNECQLGGTLDGWLPSLSNLVYLKLNENFFVGSPISISSLSHLRLLELYSNEFDKDFPFVEELLSKLPKLSEFDLNEHDTDFLSEIKEFCQDHEISFQAYMP